MNYKETLNYLYAQLPMFHRVGAAAYKANLDNTIAICSYLDSPENKFKSVHVAGTNGKGSTSHMIASILQSAGYKVGLYTSPHLKDFRERIRINGKMISKKSVVSFVEKHKHVFDKIKPSFFEWTVGLAFDHFAKQKVDIAVVEVGLGGRLDSTNVITPEVCVITNISYDHQNLLGNTLPLIAAEKAGIIKTTVPIVVGETQPEVKKVFLEKARALHAPIYFADKSFQVKRSSLKQGTKPVLDLVLNRKGIKKAISILSELCGVYQHKNIVTVLKAVEELKSKGWRISDKHIRKGIAEVVKQTGLQGRWQVLQKHPLVVADTGHNEAGIKEVLKQIKSTKHKHLHFVLGVVGDKDVSKVLKLLPEKARYYFCKADIPRALDAHELAKACAQLGLKGEVFPSVRKALTVAKKNAGKNDLVFVGGSTFTVAEII